MHVFVTLLRRGLGTFFMSLTGYVIVAATAFLVGESFVVLIKNLGSAASPVPVTELFYRTYFFWLILLLATPVITMRLFALEKFSGTFETLMTTRVRDFQVVAAKFMAAWLRNNGLWFFDTSSGDRTRVPGHEFRGQYDTSSGDSMCNLRDYPRRPGVRGTVYVMHVTTRDALPTSPVEAIGRGLKRWVWYAVRCRLSPSFLSRNSLPRSFRGTFAISRRHYAI